MTECLTDRTLALLGEGLLSPEARAQVRAHLLECADCEALAVEVLRQADAWAPPASFDGFRVGEELGRGGMGVVYRAFNLRLMREVALKFIGREAPDARAQGWFQNEAHLLAQVSHPNVLTIHSYGHVDGHPYIEFEYIRGRSLAKLQPPLPWPQVLDIGLDLARGLAAAHRQGVLHRDIKPSNAILTESGVVKLLDFGLAARRDPDGAEDAIPGGTPDYMAPECARGTPATERSDLYSLGGVLHHLCTGRLPGPGALVGPGVDPELAAAVERCLRADPAERFASADLLRQALEPLRARLPGPLPPNPYRGFAAFEQEHQALFFGRDADLRTVLERLRRHRLVLVVAESGEGKSSLCRAGVLPRAATGVLDEDRALATAALTPGRRPLEALGEALIPTLGEDAPALARDPDALRRRLAERYRERGGLLLFVDQLEELLTTSDPEQRDAFARALGEVPRASPAVRLLLAVRGDFFTRVAALPGLAGQVEQALYLLRPMTPEGLRAAIVRPAHALGVSFESEALIQHLVDATAGGAGSLPLLSFALTELWERRDRGGARITRAALNEMGGVEGLLARHADGVVDRLSGPQRAAARRLLLRLTTADRTRIERSEDELDAGSPDAQAALRGLVFGRLLQARTVSGQLHYQIAHDALLLRWPLLASWLDDDVGHRALRQRVELAAREWVRQERSPETLWQQRQLKESRALDGSALGPVALEFLDASRRWLRRRRQQQRLRWLVVAGLVASPFVFFQLRQWNADNVYVSGQWRAAEAQLEEARSLAREACARREQSLAWFDLPLEGPPQPGEGAGSSRDMAQQRWADALACYERAQHGFDAAEQVVRAALGRAHDRERPGALLARVASARLALEECFHPQGAVSTDVARRMDRFDDDTRRSRTQGPTEQGLEVEPTSANVELKGEASPRPADGVLLVPWNGSLPCLSKKRTLSRITTQGSMLWLWGMWTGWTERDRIRGDEHQNVLASMQLGDLRLVGGHLDGAVKGAVFQGTTGDEQAVKVAICGEVKDAADPSLAWYDLEVWNPVAQDWENPCMPAGDVLNPRAVALAGAWDSRGAHRDDAGTITFACTTGVLARCVGWRYKPWEMRQGRSMADVFQACTRMARSDYCGNGVSHTHVRTLIEYYDEMGISSRMLEATYSWDPKLASFEAAWAADGASCLARTRDGQPLADIWKECPARFKMGAADLGGGDRCVLVRTGPEGPAGVLRNRVGGEP